MSCSRLGVGERFDSRLCSTFFADFDEVEAFACNGLFMETLLVFCFLVGGFMVAGEVQHLDLNTMRAIKAIV